MEKEKWIKSEKYEFDWTDLTTLFTVVGTLLTILGFGLIGTIVFVANCLFGIVLVIAKTKRFNLLFLQIALLALNTYFLLA